MADYTIIAASVQSSGTINGVTLGTNIALESITAGQPLYLATDGTVGLCTATGTSITRVYYGTSLNGAATGQPVTVCRGDPSWTFGATIAAGQMVIVSSTAGKFCPVADKTTGWYVTPVGCGIGSNKIQLYPVGQLQASAASV